MTDTDLDHIAPTRDDCAENEPIAAAPEPGRRIILLSGQALVRSSTYLMEATLFASSSGALDGEILWTVSDVPGCSAGTAGVELVRGSAGPSELHFSGYRVDGPFMKERYRIFLYGTDAVGVFQGASEAYGVYDARLSGRFQVVNERG